MERWQTDWLTSSTKTLLNRWVQPEDDDRQTGWPPQQRLCWTGEFNQRMMTDRLADLNKDSAEQVSSTEVDDRQTGWPPMLHRYRGYCPLYLFCEKKTQTLKIQKTQTLKIQWSLCWRGTKDIAHCIFSVKRKPKLWRYRVKRTKDMNT